MAQIDDQDKDLGFGRVASATSTKRLINRDGSFNVARRALSFWKSAGVYQALLSMGWGRFLVFTSMGYLALNLFFALLYFLIDVPMSAIEGDDPGAWNTFLRCFFFSVQTSSTIGYGHVLPAHVAANVLVTIESYVGLIGVALITGLVFARFSRPMAHILFSDHALIAPYGETGRALMFRIVNGRQNQLIELSVQMSISWMEEGVRQFRTLKLERSRVPFFSLNWTIVHPIDDNSPMRGLDVKKLRQHEAEVTILLTGMDETFSQTVHTRSSYRADEIVQGARFLPMFHDDPHEGIVLEVDKLSEYEHCELR